MIPGSSAMEVGSDMGMRWKVINIISLATTWASVPLGTKKRRGTLSRDVHLEEHGSRDRYPPIPLRPWVRTPGRGVSSHHFRTNAGCKGSCSQSKGSGRVPPGFAVRSCQREWWVRSEHEWDTDSVCDRPKLHYVYLIYYVCVYSVCV